MQIDGKIQALNNAVREAIPHLRDEASQQPHAQVYVRALQFSIGARWHIANPTPVEDLVWPDLTAGGYTDLGAALRELATQLQVPPMEPRALPPVVVLVSDGRPTDDYQPALEHLLSLPWGAKAVRLAIAIGGDADREVLERFIANPEFPPFSANSPERLAELMRWVSTAVVGGVSSPSGVAGTSHIAAPPVPASTADDWVTL